MSSVIRLPLLTSAGLTTSVTAYTSGDQMGTELNASMVDLNPRQRIKIVGVVIVDAAAVLAATDLYLFSAATTPAADNAAASWSDADMLNCQNVINLTQANVSALNKTITWEGTKYVTLGAAGALFVDLVTRSGNSFFAAVGDITTRIYAEV